MLISTTRKPYMQHARSFGNFIIQNKSKLKCVWVHGAGTREFALSRTLRIFLSTTCTKNVVAQNRFQKVNGKESVKLERFPFLRPLILCWVELVPGHQQKNCAVLVRHWKPSTQVPFSSPRPCTQEWVLCPNSVVYGQLKDSSRSVIETVHS